MQAKHANSEYRVDAKIYPTINEFPKITEESLVCSDIVRILLIEDDPTVCKMMKAAFGRHDFKVDTIINTFQIEKTLERQPYQLILLNYDLPGLKWSAVLDCLRQFQEDASIIVFTEYPSIDSVLNCLRAQTHDYLTKPFSIVTLKATVRRCLQGKGLLRLTETALRENLGLVLREQRKMHNLTLSQMSRRTGVSLGYLSQLELGRNAASVETLYRLALGLKLKLSELFAMVEDRD